MKNKFIKLFIICAIVVLIAPIATKSATNEEIQTQIKALISQIQALQAQLAQLQGSVEQQWCHTFNTNLKIGDSGSEVSALQNALHKEGYVLDRDVNSALKGGGEIGEQTASAITGFQEKYASDILTPNGLNHGTGYVGPSTRKKLNQLYGCKTVVTDQVGKLLIEPANPYIKVGDTLQLQALYQPLMPPCPSGVFCAQAMPASMPVTASWSVSNLGVINLVTKDKDSASGVTVKGIGVGTTDIKAVYALPSGSVVSATTNVTVAGAATQPSITVLSPNGGEVFKIGDILPIRWQSDFPASVIISLRGKASELKITYNPSETGNYNWTIPSSVEPGSYSIHLEATGISGKVFTDDSNAPFSITNATACPQLSSPASVWCANGKVIPGGVDANGCQLAPDCTVTTTQNVTPSKTLVTSGETISVSWNVSVTTTSATDWIGIAPRGGQWSSSYNWFYTDGLASGSKTITMPVSGGSYDLVYYLHNGFTEFTRTGPVTVVATLSDLGTQVPSEQYSASMLNNIKANLDQIQKEINDLHQ